jgi:hypothetical protein
VAWGQSPCATRQGMRILGDSPLRSSWGLSPRTART